MRIAISATGPSLDDEVDPRFGRCQYFIIVDPESLEFEALENSSQTASGGAGIASAQLVADRGAKAVLSGNLGPNAYRVLEAAGIDVIAGVSGSVRDALEGYKAGRFAQAAGPSVSEHFGMGGGMGPGGGSGRGMGRGGVMMPGTGVEPVMLAKEVDALKAQTRALGQQLSDILGRLDDLERKGQ